MRDNNKNKIGSIYYDKRDNRYRCTYYIIDKENLTETRKTKSFLTEQEAKDFLATVQCQRGNELFIKYNGIPFNQLMRATAQKKFDTNLIEERQFSRILDTISCIEKCPAMKKNIEDITSEEIQSYLNTLTNYSYSTISKIFEQFKQNFTYAYEKGYLRQNPLIDVIKPRSHQIAKKVRALEVEEQQSLTNYLMNTTTEREPYKVAYLIEMYLGLRVGETLALKSTDIDLNKNLVNVNKTLTTDQNHKVVMGKSTKTYAGIRQVPIPTFIRGEIINQMRLAENNKDKQLFVNTKGDYANPRTVNRFLKRTLKTMGIDDISTHSLRHTYGTRCIEAGMRGVAVQRLMGHSDISVTLNTYTSVFNKYKETELEKVNNYYMNNEIINSKQPVLLLEDNIISPKEKKILELTKMVETSFARGLIPIEEYRENIEYLQELKNSLNNEEKGVIER